ncbi:MAG: helix-turn-helix transcriptional regulator [Luteolibacter sp.]
MPSPEDHPLWPPDRDHKFVAKFLLILKDARIKQGLSIRELASKTEIDHGILARGESLQRIPTIVTMRRWVRGLELDFVEVHQLAEDASEQ